MWPVWIWYARRVTDGSDEPWGIAALVAAAIIMTKRWRPAPIPTGRCLAVAGLLAIYAAGFDAFPALVRAVIAMTALSILFAPQSGSVGLWSLLALSLPVLATMQFYLGYPLRLVTACGATFLLDAIGIHVTRVGLALQWSGENVLVDAPCSGIRMLWGGSVLASGICAWAGLRAKPTIAALAATFLVVMAANILRASLLFFKEANVVCLPEWTHAGIGCMCFAAATLAILNLPRAVCRAPFL